MSILLFLNDKCFYCPNLLCQGRIPEIFLFNYFNKTEDMAPIDALNIADMRNVSEGLCTQFRRSRGLNLHPASASAMFPHCDYLVMRQYQRHVWFDEMTVYYQKDYRMIRKNQRGKNAWFSTPRIFHGWYFFRWNVNAPHSSTFRTMCIPSGQDNPSFYDTCIHATGHGWASGHSGDDTSR